MENTIVVGVNELVPVDSKMRINMKYQQCERIGESLSEFIARKYLRNKA